MTGDILTAYFADKNAPTPQRAAPATRATTTPTRGGVTARPAAPTPAAQRAATLPGDGKLQRVEGFGRVHVSTATDIVQADRGVYNAETGIAQMSGNVRITRGERMLEGDYVEVNMVTGVSRLTSTGDGRVRGVLTPERSTAAPAPAARPAPNGQNNQQQRTR
jgi:lipopolysaccharide export system protein LptA